MHQLLLATALLITSPSLAVAAPRDAVFSETALRIDESFHRYQQENRALGMAWGIVQSGRPAHVGTAGKLKLGSNRAVHPDSLFRIASMTKAFTALAILKLRDDGRVRLDALAEDYIPEMRNWRYPTSDSPRIRVGDLLSHVGGFVKDDAWADRQTPLPEDDFTRMVERGVPFTRPPQTQFEYSNFGYALLGRIITNASGRPYKEYIEQEIMHPLGMSSSGFDIFAAPQARRALGYRWEDGKWIAEPQMGHGAFGSIGGIQTSASDYGKWLSFLLSAWPAREGPEKGPVRRSTVREMAQGLNFLRTKETPAASGSEPCQAPAAYGKGFFVSVDCALGFTMFHGGDYPGYGSFLLLMPERGTAVYAFTNRAYTSADEPVWNAALELHRSGLLPAAPTPDTSNALATTYAAAIAMFRAGDVAAGRGRLAMNFLMDRSAEGWVREFSRLKAQSGECDTSAPITATGALTGSFVWECERGKLQGRLALAPTDPVTIQSLGLRVNPSR